MALTFGKDVSDKFDLGGIALYSHGGALDLYTKGQLTDFARTFQRLRQMYPEVTGPSGSLQSIHMWHPATNKAAAIDYLTRQGGQYAEEESRYIANHMLKYDAPVAAATISDWTHLKPGNAGVNALNANRGVVHNAIHFRSDIHLQSEEWALGAGRGDGGLVNGTVPGVLVHEFGHHLYNLNRLAAYPGGYSQAGERSALNSSTDLLAELVHPMGVSINMDGSKVYGAERVLGSRYANENEDELAAELFTRAHTPGPGHEESRAVVRAIRKSTREKMAIAQRNMVRQLRAMGSDLL